MWARIGVGSRMTISMSKIRNNTARRKNRRENGIRAFDRGENPHSNGLAVSRSNHGVEVLVARVAVIIMIRIGIIIAIMGGIIMVIIF